MSKVLVIHGQSIPVKSKDVVYDFIFRKINADRFDLRYEVLKNRITGKTGHIVLYDDISEMTKDDQ